MKAALGIQEIRQNIEVLNNRILLHLRQIKDIVEDLEVENNIENIYFLETELRKSNRLLQSYLLDREKEMDKLIAMKL